VTVPRTLLVAAVTVVLIGGGAWGLQAVGLIRPSPAQLELVKTLHALTAFHGSQAILEVDGRRYRALCTQHWDPGQRVARVVLDRAEIATRAANRFQGVDLPARDEAELAGCPRPLLSWLSDELVEGASVRFRTITTSGSVLHEIEFHPQTLPIVLFVAGSSSLPVRLRLTASGVQGTSIVHYGELR
jgi:hypothetical protein